MTRTESINPIQSTDTQRERMVLWKVGEPPDRPGEKPGGRLEYVLHTGWWLGKRIAIAGAAISSAPVVVPPLVILSTLGFAFAVPFGVFFAGYACTNKIMRSLLCPMPTPTPAAADDEEEEIFGELEFEEGQEGIGTWGNGGEEKLMGEGRIEEEAVPVRGKEECIASPERGELPGVPGVEGYPCVAVAMVEHEIVPKRQLEGEENNYIPARGKEGSTTSSEQGELEGAPMVAGYPCVAVTLEEHEVCVEQSGLSSEYASAVEDHSLDTAEVESTCSVEPLVLKAMSTAGAPEIVAVVPIGEEVLYGEEKIWEQIAAMRAIVGYTASPYSSCIEELKALYIFTGVEPPISFEESSDLVEINDKLRFLKSVVGVK